MQIQIFQQRQGKGLGLVGDAGEGVTLGVQLLQAFDHSGKGATEFGNARGIVLLKQREAAFVHGGVRLGHHLAGEGALHEARHAVTDPGGDEIKIGLRAPQIFQHAIGAGGEVGRGVDQRPVQVEHHHLHRQRKRRRLVGSEAHIYFALASSARSALSTVL